MWSLLLLSLLLCNIVICMNHKVVDYKDTSYIIGVGTTISNKFMIISTVSLLSHYSNKKVQFCMIT